MRSFLALLALALLLPASGGWAGDLFANDSSIGEAPIRFLRRPPTPIERIKRDAQGASVGEAYYDRALDRLRRDTDRADTRRKLDESMERLSRNRITTRDTGLLPGYSLDIRGEDRVIGTGKLFMRLGRMVDAAGTALGDGRLGNAQMLVDAARLDLREDHWPMDDPNVIALTSRLDSIQAQLDENAGATSR